MMLNCKRIHCFNKTLFVLLLLLKLNLVNGQRPVYDSIAFLKDTELLDYLNQAGLPFIERKDSSAAARFASAWQQRARKQQDILSEAAAYAFAGNVFKQLGGSGSALTNYQSALKLVENDKRFRYLQPVLLHQIGWLYYQEDQNALGLENLITANMLMERLGYDRFPRIAEYLYELGYCYGFYYEDFAAADRYIKKALNTPTIDPHTQVLCHKILGVLYQQARQLPASNAAFNTALLKAIQQKDTVNIGEIAGDIGYNYYLEGQPDSSLQLLRVDYHYSFLKGNWPSACMAKVLMVSIALQKKELDSAISYKNEVWQLLSANRTAFTKKAYYILCTAFYRAVIQLEKQLGNDKATIAAQDSLDHFRTQLLNTKDSREQLAVQVKLITANKDYQLQLLKSEEGRKRLISYGLILLLVLTTVIALLVARQQQLKVKAAEQKLVNYANLLVENNQLLEQLSSSAEQQPAKTEYEREELFRKLRTRTLLTEQDRQLFKTDFESIYKNFFSNIREQIPNISPAEMRLIALIKLDLSAKEMAEMQGISPDSVSKAKYRLKKKLESSARENNELSIILKNVAE